MRQAAVKTKKELKSLLVEERKTMREKAAQSKFMQKTSNIYRSMANRLNDWSKLDIPIFLPFSIEQFRQWVREQMSMGCRYCGTTLRISNVAVDHKTPIARKFHIEEELWSLDNLACACKSCNWQKGILDFGQFLSLNLWIDEHLAEPEKSDFRRRLTIGGKWGVRV